MPTSCPKCSTVVTTRQCPKCGYTRPDTPLGLEKQEDKKEGFSGPDRRRVNLNE